MNVININQTEFKKYVHDYNFIRTQMRRYSDWLVKYRDVGEVAFPSFVIMTKPNDVLKIALTVNHEPDVDKYSIVALCWFRMEGSQPIDDMFPILVSCEQLDGKVLDIYFEIIEDENWKKIGVRTTDDLDDRSATSIQKILPSILTLFAKVQTDALKCRKKVIRLGEKYDKTNKKIELNYDQEITSKPIVLSPGITYSIRRENAEERTFIRRCEAWMVRGHYRHYKSGKVVFIKSHIKGKGRLKETRYTINEWENSENDVDG